MPEVWSARLAVRAFEITEGALLGDLDEIIGRCTG